MAGKSLFLLAITLHVLEVQDIHNTNGVKGGGRGGGRVTDRTSGGKFGPQIPHEGKIPNF
jgi:hypothetical protein